MRVFRVQREENYKDDMVPKRSESGVVEVPMNVFAEVMEALCTERMIVGTLKEKDGWQTSIL